MGVGHVKADRIIVSLPSQARLSMRAVVKGQAFGCSMQVAAEDGPEHPTSGDKVLAVSLKIKLLRPHVFIRGKVVEEALNL
jgi:hypothetical protein